MVNVRTYSDGNLLVRKSLNHIKSDYPESGVRNSFHAQKGHANNFHYRKQNKTAASGHRRRPEHQIFDYRSNPSLTYTGISAYWTQRIESRVAI
jgi:hypothetical protein